MKYSYNFEGYVLKYINIFFFELLIFFKILYICVFQANTLQNWTPFAKEYDPLKAGSIDGTDTEPHDKAISRAIQAHYESPHGLKSKPERTLFVARFGPKITKHDLKEVQ